MHSKSVEIMVGMFVAAGIAALVMLAMKVSNLASFTEEAGYEIVAHFENIGGLKVRSPVTMSGVRVGRVSGIDYDGERMQARVHMVIESRYRQLPVDTSASIYTAGLLGEQYVGLDPGAEEVFLKDGSEISLTQSALVVEQLIGQFLFSKTADKPAE